MHSIEYQKRLKELGGSGARDKLLGEYKGSLAQLRCKYASMFPAAWFDSDDVASVIRMLAMRAVDTWNPARGTLTRHLYAVVTNGLHDEAREIYGRKGSDRSAVVRTVPLDSENLLVGRQYLVEGPALQRALIAEVRSRIPQDVFEYFRLTSEGFTAIEIARMLGKKSGSCVDTAICKYRKAIRAQYAGSAAVQSAATI